MYGKYKKRPSYGYKKKKSAMSPTKRAYLAGLRRGKAIARSRRRF